MTWQPQGGWGQPPAGPPPPGPFGPQGPFGPPPQGPYAPGPMMKPDRSALILILALSGLFATMFGCVMCGPLALAGLGLSIPAIVMARRDLAEMQAGTMVPTGRDTTNVGLIFAIITSVFSALAGLFMLIVALLYGGLILATLGLAAAGG